MTTRDVPCDGCVRCCINDAVRLMPYDDASLYKTEPHAYAKGELMLAHKVDHRGKVCYYLGDNGCSIHATRPAQCRSMDCRVLAQSFTFTHARLMDKRGQVRLGVWQRGRELIAKGA